MLKRVVTAALAVVVLAGSVAACGSSGEGASASGAGSWKVGVLNSCSGTLAEAGASNAGACDVFKAWVADLNKNGGIKGHKIDLFVKDDGGNPAKSQTLVRELVEKDKVIALLGSPPSPQFGAYLQQKKVPLIAAGSTSAEFLKNPMFFNVSVNFVGLVFGMVKEAVKAGNTKLGFMYCAEDPACAAAQPLVAGAAALNAASMTTVKVAATAPDYTAQCLKLKDAGVTMMQIGSAPQVAMRVLDSCASQGFNVKLMAAAGSVNESFLANKRTNGMVGISGTAPWFDSSIPGIKKMQDVLSAAGIKSNGPGVTDAWAAAKTFEAAAKSLDSNPTASDVLTALYALKGETSEGLTQPLTFTAGRPNITSSGCYFPFTIKDGKYESTNNGKPFCVDQGIVDAVLKQLPS